MESNFLPFKYSINRATEQDIRQFNQKAVFLKIPIILLLFLLTSVFLVGITVGLHEWEIGQRAMLYELGTRSATPSFQDLLKIIFVAFGKAMIVITPRVLAYFATYLIVRLLIKRQIRQLDLWVAKYQDKIIVLASLQIQQNYSILRSIYVNSEHHSQGVGSSLVWNSVKDVNKPIYLICLPQLQYFYNRLEFIFVENFSPELKQKKLYTTPLLTIFSRWQEWIVESGDRPIAYAHLSSRPKCSILYSLYIEPQHQRVIIAQAFMEHFTRRIQLPLYVICRREEVKFFKQLGFFTTNQQVLLFELKILRFAHQVVLRLSN